VISYHCCVVLVISKNSTCRYQSNDVAGRCDYSFEIVGESDLQAAVATIGPIVIYIHASDSFKDYYMG